MTDKEPGFPPIPYHEKFNYFIGPDGESYRTPKPEFAAEIAQESLVRMSAVAKHNRAAMDRLPVEQSS